MKNKTIYIFRHGETIVSKHGGFYTTKNSAQLLPEAKVSLQKLGKYLQQLPMGQHLVSPKTRCQQTIEIVTGGTDRKFVTDVRLSEYGLETPMSFIRRLSHLVDEIKNSNEEYIYLCTHGIVISALISLLSKEKISPFDFVKGAFTPIKPGVLTVIKNQDVEYISFRE